MAAAAAAAAAMERKAAAVGDTAPSRHHPEAERAWRQAVQDESTLRDYAEAAEEVGNRTWVITALHWCAKEIEGFLWAGGAVEAEIRSARHRYFHANGGNQRMSKETEEETRAKLRNKLTVQGGGMVPAVAAAGGDPSSVKPSIIDVGSCWDYFRRYEQKLEVGVMTIRSRDCIFVFMF